LTENHIKRQVKDLLSALGIFNYHVLAGLGAFPGLPDRVMHYKGRVIYLELKSATGKMRDAQVRFQEQCRQDGIDYWVIRDADELYERIRSYEHD